MLPTWDPKDAEAESPYQDRQVHSEGMISFTYRKPTQETLEALKHTETYRRLTIEASVELEAPEPE